MADVKKIKEEPKKMRELIIATDGVNINIVKNEMAGTLELQALLETLLRKITIR